MAAFVELAGATAVVTGAGSGIGRACSHALAAHGCAVVVTDLDEGRAQRVVADIEAAGGTAVAAACDVRSVDDLSRARDRALEQFGRVDVVINNVGVIAVGAPDAIPYDEWVRAVDINLLSVVRSNEVFLPLLLAQGRGHVINTASAAGLLAYGYDRLPYTATKHAVVGLSESLAIYLRPRGIGVSCLCPAGVRTNIVEQITFYGDAAEPRAPAFPLVDAPLVGELVVDAIEQDRFLILTAREVGQELVRWASDIDGYVKAQSGEAP